MANIVPAASSEFETSLGVWAAWFSCTVEQSTEQANNGSGSMKVTATSSNPAVQTNNWPGFSSGVVAGHTYAVSWALGKFGGPNRTMTLNVLWRNESGTNLGETNIPITTSNNTFTQSAVVESTAPTGTTRLFMTITSTGFASGNEVYVDSIVVDDEPGGAVPHEVTATIPLSLLFDPVAEAAHEVTASIPLSVDMDVTAQASHSVAASIPLSLTVEPATAAPGVGAHEVTCTIPLSIALDPMTKAQHDVTAQIPLSLDVQATASAPTVGAHEVTAVIPLTLLVSAQSLAAHQVAAEIPLSVDIAPTVETVHEVTATIPLMLAVDAVAGDLVDTSLALAPHTTVIPSPHVSTNVPDAHTRTSVPDVHVRTVIPSLHVTTTLE